MAPNGDQMEDQQRFVDDKDIYDAPPSPTPSADESLSSSINIDALHLSSPLPDPVASFFSNVSTGGFPKPAAKAQPWKSLWDGPQHPSADGKLIVACPKICDYGSNNLGGY